jgi:hypothetical protein
MNYITTKQGFADFVGGTFFTVCFTKADGTERILNGRMGVRKHLRGGKSKACETQVVVWDCKIKDYRSFHLHTAKWVKAHGMVIDLAAMQIRIDVVKAPAVNHEIRKAA